MDVHPDRSEPVILAAMRHIRSLSVPALAVLLVGIAGSTTWTVCSTVVVVAGMAVLLAEQLRRRR